MQTQTSNRIQRRNALLRATALLIIVMLLTGFCASLFPKATSNERNRVGNDCSKSKMDLIKIIESENNLQKTLSELEHIYATIIEQDNIWEKTSESEIGIRGTVEQKIDDLSAEMRANINDLGKVKEQPLYAHAANVYHNLLITRKMIAELRRKEPFFPVVPPFPNSNSNGTDTRDIIKDIEDEAQFLEDQIAIKGWFWDKNGTKDKINRVASRLRNIAQSLRN
jgi:hypothetical protein